MKHNIAKDSVPGKKNIECPLTLLANGGPYDFLVFNFPTVERSDRKDLLSSSWLTLFFYLNGPFPCSRPFEIHPKLWPWWEDEKNYYCDDHQLQKLTLATVNWSGCQNFLFRHLTNWKTAKAISQLMFQSKQCAIEFLFQSYFDSWNTVFHRWH